MGEALLQTSYATGQRLPLRPRAALKAARSLLSWTREDLTPTTELMRSLSDPDRLRMVSLLLGEPRTVAELAKLTRQPPFEVRHRLDRLSPTGALILTGDEANPAYSVRPDLGRALAELLAAMPQPSVPA
jgi:DNA-binding transcriptional ArsR family regulator